MLNFIEEFLLYLSPSETSRQIKSQGEPIPSPKSRDFRESLHLLDPNQHDRAPIQDPKTSPFCESMERVYGRVDSSAPH